MKICSKCKIEKELDCFSKNCQQKDGLRSYCKSCIKEQSLLYRTNNLEKCKQQQEVFKEKNPNWNKEYAKKYREENKTSEKERHRKYQLEHREQETARIRSWRQKNKERVSLRRKQIRKENPEKINARRNYLRQNDIQYALKDALRLRVYLAIKQGKKAGSAVRDLGCPIPELKEHIEKQWQKGMSWDNWTTDGWHIDHIKPLSKFDLTNQEQFLEANNYTNLQPMWAIDNIKKSNKQPVTTQYEKSNQAQTNGQ